MKKTASLILLICAFTLSVNAQKKGNKNNPERVLKKMTSDLNLTEVQQEKIKPLLISQAEDRKFMQQEREKLKNEGVKPSKKDRKKTRDNRIAKEELMASNMQLILDKNQFEKYQDLQEEMKDKRKGRDNKRVRN